MNDHIESITDRIADAGHVGARARHLPPVRRWHRAVRRLRQGAPAVRGADRRGLARRRRRRPRPSARGGHRRRSHRHRRVLLRWPHLVPRRGTRALGAAVGFYGGGIVTGRFPQFPPLIDEVAGVADAVARTVRRRRRVHSGRRRRAAARDARRERCRRPRRSSATRGAQHGFNCDQRPSYHPEAAADAWQRTLAWFGTHLR